MLWNELDYDDQIKVLDKISSLVEKEKDSIVKSGLVAALNELDIWSNTPCNEPVDIYKEEFDVSLAFDSDDSAVEAVALED